jgi:hypothetical protein
MPMRINLQHQGDVMNANTILIMYSVIVGLGLGKSICTTKSDDVFIAIIGLIGLGSILMFNNPGNQSTLEITMWIIIAISTTIVSCIAYITIFKEAEESNSLKELKDAESRPKTDRVRYSLQPQHIEQILQRQNRIERSIANRKAELP